jgi:two-component system, cell cycle sensor histidine kinase and response regulator CckA
MAEDPAAARDVDDEAYRRLFTSHPAAMAIWDPATGRILAANDAALVQYGYSPEEILALTVDRIVHPEDLERLRAQLPNLPDGLAGAAPFRHVRKNGDVLEVEMSGHPLEWAGRPARLVIAVDVTERRRLEQELRASRAIEAVGRLAGGIAHDFNNLVMAINGFADLLLERLPAESEEHEAALEIQTAGLRAAALTGQLLAFARPHAARPTRFELDELVQSLEETLRGVVGPHVSVRIVTSATRSGIMADRDQIARAIVGCALNARGAMPDGGTLLLETMDVTPPRARDLAGASGDTPFVGLAISDTGSGGSGLGGSGGGDPERTGLGLALVYSTVQLAGGRIRLESTPGRGSTVRILLPLDGTEDGLAAGDGSREASVTTETARPDEAPPVTGASEAVDVPEPDDPADRGSRSGVDVVPGVPRGRAARIAVVEDEPGVRSLVARILARAGHRVIEFADGGKAIDGLADAAVEVDLMITDLVMPGPNGIETARQVRRDRPGLPVLLMSGFAADALRAEGLDEASVELLGKPFSAAELLTRVASLVDPEVAPD